MNLYPAISWMIDSPAKRLFISIGLEFLKSGFPIIQFLFSNKRMPQPKEVR
jgi:hypothetical protein